VTEPRLLNHEKGARRRLFLSRSGRLGFAAGKAHGGSAGAVVGLDIDKADHALRLFDIFGVATQGLDHFAAARIAEIFTHSTAVIATSTL